MPAAATPNNAAISTDILPFWSPSVSELSKRFPLPEKTHYEALRSTSCNKSWQNLASNSWFTANTWVDKQNPTATMSSSASFPSLLRDLRVMTDNAQQRIASTTPLNPSRPVKKQRLKLAASVNDEKPPVGRAKKIRLYPTTKQSLILNAWFHARNWTYNQCVMSIEEHGVKREKKVLRALWLNKEALEEKFRWALETPYDIRNEAMCDVLKAYKTSFALLKKKHIKHFKMKYCKRKAASHSIVIHSSHWKNTQEIFYAAAFEKREGERTLRTSEPLPEKILYDCRLQRTRLGHFYFCLLLPVTASDSQARNSSTVMGKAPKILSIDPGVRTFLTGYEPSTRRYIEWGKGDMNRIERLCAYLDDLMSRTVRSTSKRQRYKMRKAEHRMRLRIRNLVDEFHKKLVAWLAQNYELILLPKFKSSGLVKRSTRRISRLSVRAMLSWSFYRFTQRLLMKTRHTACSVVIVSEAYTTMTCGSCGNLNHNVGTEKVFKCPACGVRLPRDWNAARNIFLRYTTTLPSTPSDPERA